LPVSVLVTAGDEETASRLGAPPANAVIAGYLPQADVLPACAAVVHHAGAGTAFGVLAHGLPSLAMPQSADNFRIARSLETAGAARVLMAADVTAEAVRAALLDVLAEPSYRRSAEAVAREMTAMPGPTEIVPSLVNLARSTREEHR
jgi:UDP:flavonoid glycosyltransferase YjiC (YdhE family)